MTIASAIQASGVTTCSQDTSGMNSPSPAANPIGKTGPPGLALDGDQNRCGGWHRDRPPGQWLEGRVERQTAGECEADRHPTGELGRLRFTDGSRGANRPSRAAIANVVGKPGHFADPPLHNTPRASCGHESSVAVCAPYNAARHHAAGNRGRRIERPCRTHWLPGKGRAPLGPRAIPPAAGQLPLSTGRPDPPGCRTPNRCEATPAPA